MMNTMTHNGMINIASPHDITTTANRLDEVLRANDMNIIARVNHAQAAANAGLALRPTELLIFGNPQAGTTNAMQSNRGHRLPTKSAGMARRPKSSLDQFQ